MSDNSEKRDPRTYAIIGAAMEVHRVLGGGFLESVYNEAFSAEMTQRNIPFKREVEINIFYKEKPLESKFRADFICFEGVIVEIKAISKITTVEESQIINYLKATKKEVGLLVNFGGPSLSYKRFILNRSV